MRNGNIFLRYIPGVIAFLIVSLTSFTYTNCQKTELDLSKVDPTVGSSNSGSAASNKSIYFFILVHTGEGGTSKCGFENISLSDTVYASSGTERARYINCRDGIINLSEEIYDLGMKAVFQFHGGILEHLYADSDFSFENHITALGNEVGLHHHTECRTNIDTTYLDNSINPATCPSALPGDWANSSGLLQPSSDQMLVRFLSLLETSKDVEQENILSYCGWGAPHVIDSEIKQIEMDSNYEPPLMDLLSENKLHVLTSTAEFPIDWSSHNESNCDFYYNESTEIKINVHPIKLHKDYDLYYYDSANSLFGEKSYNSNNEEDAFGLALSCIESRYNNSDYQGEIFTWSWTTHLHNTLSHSTAQAISDLENFKSFMEKYAGIQGFEMKYSTLKEIHNHLQNTEVIQGANYQFEY